MFLYSLRHIVLYNKFEKMKQAEFGFNEIHV